MRDAGWPVVFDATHSVRLPGGVGAASSGHPEIHLTHWRARRSLDLLAGFRRQFAGD